MSISMASFCCSSVGHGWVACMRSGALSRSTLAFGFVLMVTMVNGELWKGRDYVMIWLGGRRVISHAGL